MSRTIKGAKAAGYGIGKHWIYPPGATTKRYLQKSERQAGKLKPQDISEAMWDLAELRDKCSDPNCDVCGSPLEET